MAKEPVALLIEFDLATGKRAGDISPYDRGLLCLAQDLESVPAREIRLILDNRDPSQYEGIPGVKIIRGKDNINRMIDEIAKPMYVIKDPELFRISLQELGISLREVIETVKGKYRKLAREDLDNKVLEELYNRGILGIKKFQRARKL